MKATALLALSILIVSSAAVCAQEYRHEVSVGVGLATVPDLLESFMTIAPLLFAPSWIVREESEWVIPALTVHHRYHASRLISVGINFTYQKFNRELYLLNERTSTSAINYYTVMGRVDFTYVRTRLFRMYSGAALGFSHATESGEDVEDSGETYFAFQVNAVGLRVGKQFAGYLELGFGFNGVMALGLMHQF